MRLGTALSLLAFAACGGEATGPADSPLAGTWRYEAVQESPAAELRGDVMWRATGADAFEGTVSFTETTAAGVRIVSGTSAGTLYADTLAEFTFIVAGATRLHLGALRRDSVAGAWTALSGGAARGTFILRRSP